MMVRVDAGLKLPKVEAVCRSFRLGLAGGEGGGTEQGHRGGNAERAAHDLTAAIALEDDIADRLPTGRAAGNIVMGLGRRGSVAEGVGFRHARISRAVP
jgi:hypothetical protein